MGLFDGIIGAGADLIGGLLGNKQNKDINSANNSFNEQEAQLNRNFQQDMSNTAYQRAVADMKSAGLNPMLAYSQGGASAPSGSQASAASAAPMQNVMHSAVGSYNTTQQTAAQTENINQDTQVKKTEATKNEATTANSRMDTDLKWHQILEKQGKTPGEAQKIINMVREQALLEERKRLTEQDVKTSSALEGSHRADINLKHVNARTAEILGEKYGTEANKTQAEIEGKLSEKSPWLFKQGVHTINSAKTAEPTQGRRYGLSNVFDQYLQSQE